MGEESGGKDPAYLSSSVRLLHLEGGGVGFRIWVLKRENGIAQLILGKEKIGIKGKVREKEAKEMKKGGQRRDWFSGETGSRHYDRYRGSQPTPTGEILTV